MADTHELDEAAAALNRAFPQDPSDPNSVVHAELAELSGIQDAEVLDRMVELGITAATLPALSLYPLVAVAWADGRIQRAERRAILEAAEEGGLNNGSLAHNLLRAHLRDEAPDPVVVEAWATYIVALCAGMSPDQRAALRRGLLSRTRAIAEAAHGRLGLEARISPAEDKVLAELEGAFD
jgi:hypothetical protein